MVSFAARVKNEMCRAAIQRTGAARAECYGVLLYCNTFSTQEVRIITENGDFAGRLPKLFQKAFGVHFDRQPEEDAAGKLIFQITDGEKLGRIIDALGFDPRQMLVQHVNFGILEEEADRCAFLRGAFLAGGSVTDPEKRYHLELASSHVQASREVSTLLEDTGFAPRTVMRGGNAVIYFKLSEHIEDFLTMTGAPAAATEIMAAKVNKSLRNEVNRATNCDIANLDKTLKAAESQCRDIEKLRTAGKLDALPEQLKNTALLRMANMEASMTELARLHNPPITKSCLNHRLRKISELAKTVE